MLDTTENYYLGDAVTDEHETLEVSFEISRETLIRHYEADLLFAVEKLGSYAGVAMMIMTTFHILLLRKYDNR